MLSKRSLRLSIVLSSLVVICGLLPAPIPAAAQGNSQGNCLVTASRELVKNQWINLEMLNGDTMSGSLQRVDVTLGFIMLEQPIGDGGAGFKSVSFQGDRISRILVPQDKGIGTGAFLGGLVGGALGALAGAAIGNSEPGAWVGGALVGVALGGFVGYELQSQPDPIVYTCNE